MIDVPADVPMTRMISMLVTALLLAFCGEIIDCLLASAACSSHHVERSHFSDSKFSHGLGCRNDFPIKRHKLGISLVGMLLSVGCPSAISGLIISVVINSINGFSCWSLSHIGEKLFKNQPLIANRYPSSAIGVVRRIFRISASLNHRCPYVIFASTPFPMCTAHVSNVEFFRSDASAGFRVTAFKRRFKRDNNFSAITLGFDSVKFSAYRIWDRVRLCHHNQSVKSCPVWNSSSFRHLSHHRFV